MANQQMKKFIPTPQPEATRNCILATYLLLAFGIAT
jgi:hypothetical protein